jgi:hypothetical protein
MRIEMGMRMRARNGLGRSLKGLKPIRPSLSTSAMTGKGIRKTQI